MPMMLSTFKTYQTHPLITHLLSQRRARTQLNMKLQMLMRSRMRRRLKRMGRVTWSLLPVDEMICSGTEGSCRGLPLLGPCRMPLWDMTCVRGMRHSLLGCAVLSSLQLLIGEVTGIQRDSTLATSPFAFLHHLALISGGSSTPQLTA